MHEMSLAVALLERVLSEADRGGLRSVRQVSVELGSLQAVEPDLLVEAFRAAALNSAAEGASLDLKLSGAEALCQACGQRFQPNYRDYVCPGCGQADVKILRGRDLFLLSLSGESSEEAETIRATALG
jgi:hydrogenase nickel incorporation protein HypA/HybF